MSAIGPKRTKLDFGLELRRRHDAFKKYWGELTTPTANAGAVSRPRGERLRLAAKTAANRIITSRRGVFPLAAFHGGRQGQCGFLTISNTVLSPCCLVKKPRASWRPSSVPSKPSRRGLPFDT